MWFIVRNGKQIGPISDQNLYAHATSGKLRHKDLVWKEGMADWIEAISVPELSRFLKEIPPQPPAACIKQSPGSQLEDNKTYRPQSNVSDEKNNTNLIVSGYVCGGLSLLFFPPILGGAGFVIGILNLTKGYTGHGIAQMIISVICCSLGMVFGMIIAALSMSMIK